MAETALVALASAVAAAGPPGFGGVMVAEGLEAEWAVVMVAEGLEADRAAVMAVEGLEADRALAARSVGIGRAHV